MLVRVERMLAFTPLPRPTTESAVHSWNADVPIEVTLSGISTASSVASFANAKRPISVTVSGIT